MEGESHKAAKEKVSEELESKGFEVESEKRLDNGLIVDVFARRNDKRVLVEVGTLHGENRLDKLREYGDEVIHVTQFGKPREQTDEYTTVSFRKDFLEELKLHMIDTPFSSVRTYLKHLALTEMNSYKYISDDEAKKIGQKLKELGYVE